jgi:hypothetical protein
MRSTRRLKESCDGGLSNSCCRSARESPIWRFERPLSSNRPIVPEWLGGTCGGSPRLPDVNLGREISRLSLKGSAGTSCLWANALKLLRVSSRRPNERASVLFRSESYAGYGSCTCPGFPLERMDVTPRCIFDDSEGGSTEGIEGFRKSLSDSRDAVSSASTWPIYR